jgi:hypothetical protein
VGQVFESFLRTSHPSKSNGIEFNSYAANHLARPRARRKVKLDGNLASHRALRLLRKENPSLQGVVIRRSRQLNHLVECNRRVIKRRCTPTLSVKSFLTAAITLAVCWGLLGFGKLQFEIRHQWVAPLNG